MDDPEALPFPDPPLRDALVILRRFRPADATTVAAACADPETHRWIPVMPSPYTLADAEGFIGRGSGGPSSAIGWRRGHGDAAWPRPPSA